MSDYLSQRRAFIEAGRPLKKKEYKPIARVSEKRKQKLKEQADTDGALDKWFEEKRKLMTGKCVLCGGESEKHNDKTYRNSIHHLFEKRPSMFPSVATHDDNWLEVCFFGNSCHTNIHNGTITWQLLKDSAEWEMIFDKVKKVYPFILESEKKNIPELLIRELNA